MDLIFQIKHGASKRRTPPPFRQLDLNDEPPAAEEDQGEGGSTAREKRSRHRKSSRRVDAGVKRKHHHHHHQHSSSQVPFTPTPHSSFLLVLSSLTYLVSTQLKPNTARASTKAPEQEKERPAVTPHPSSSLLSIILCPLSYMSAPFSPQGAHVCAGS